MEVDPISKPHTLRSLEAISDYRALHRICEMCGRSYGIEVHHRRPRSIGGGDEADNFISLCYTCHVRAHSDVGFRERMEGWDEIQRR